MYANLDKLTQAGCATEKSEKLCRARGGESCAFDGAMIVLQPIADAAHLVHGPIACCGNSWEGRGTMSSKGDLHTRGFTTDMSELDIIYGATDKLLNAIRKTFAEAGPKAIFVHATCVSGLIGEDIESVCKQAEAELGIRVIPVNAPGFVGPKNLGNRIAGEVLLDRVIGTGVASRTTEYDINLIGEYNISGDLWLVEPILKAAGLRVLSRITGDSTFEEITYAHRARLNVMVCSRALINVAAGMEERYGIPFVEASFYGKTEMAKALRAIAGHFPGLRDRIEVLIAQEERKLEERLLPYEGLRGKRAVLYTGGVKSWSFISALMDLGMEIVAVGTKKSTFEDEAKMKEILGPDAPLVEDVTPKNLLRLMKERSADVLVAGGRNKYLAVKEGYPFIDVNQERHRPYAGYEGLINMAEEISSGIRYYGKEACSGNECPVPAHPKAGIGTGKTDVTIDPLKHSPALGAALAMQGIHKTASVLHGAQGCTFLGKVLLTNHFREPISLVSSKLFVESVVLGSDECLEKTVSGLIENNSPELIAVLSTGLTEVKGDDIAACIRQIACKGVAELVAVSTPDFEGGFETGYAGAVEAVIDRFAVQTPMPRNRVKGSGRINVIAGSHLSPADFTELREIVESFGLVPVMLPDLSALDGSRAGVSALALGGTSLDDIRAMGDAVFTIAAGPSLEGAALKLKERFGIEYRLFEGLSSLCDIEALMETLSMLSGVPVPPRFGRQRLVLRDGMRDAHFYFAGKRICVALEPDHALQFARFFDAMGAAVALAVIPQSGPAAAGIPAEHLAVGDLTDIAGRFDLIVSNSHAEKRAEHLDTRLFEAGFPVHKRLGAATRTNIGYAGTLRLVNDIGNLLMDRH